jgi:Putative metallopeptidase
MRAFIAVIFLLCGWCIPAQAALPLEQLLFTGRAIPFYNAPTNLDHQPIAEAVRRSQLAERMATIVNSALRIRTNLGVGFESCGVVNAFFNPQRGSITICYEFIEMVAKTAAKDQDFMMKLPREQFAKVIDGLLWGVYFHELGHAVIHINRVPVTGREEDVADQFSLWIAANFVDLSKTPIVMPTIWMWKRLAKENDIPTMTAEQRKSFLANEHSLDEQRVYNLACWIYGTGTEVGAKTAGFAGLPQERARRCSGEYAQLDASMRSHFKKYFKVPPLSGRW